MRLFSTARSRRESQCSDRLLRVREPNPPHSATSERLVLTITNRGYMGSGTRPLCGPRRCRSTFPRHQGRRSTPVEILHRPWGILRAPDEECCAGASAMRGVSSLPETSPSSGMTHHRALEPGTGQGFLHATNMDRTCSKPSKVGLARSGHGLEAAGCLAYLISSFILRLKEQVPGTGSPVDCHACTSVVPCSWDDGASPAARHTIMRQKTRRAQA